MGLFWKQGFQIRQESSPFKISTGQDYPEDLFGTGFFENFGAFFQCGAGRGDIIDEPERFVLYECDTFLRESEGISEIIQTFFASFRFHLWLGKTGAQEAVFQDGHIKSRRKRIGEYLSEE